MSPWRVLPDVIVRSAGFPWSTVDTLVWPTAAEAARCVASLEEDVLQLGEALKPRGHLSRGQLARLRSRRGLPDDDALPTDWLGEWNKATTTLALARERLAEAAASDDASVRTALWTVAADPRFLDALVCSSPGFYRDLSRTGPAGARLSRQVASYVQRLCTKCETMSFFGPINYAAIEPAAPTSYTWAGHAACAGRRAFVSAWCWEALQTRLYDDPAVAAALVPRRKMLRRTRHLSPVLADLLGRIDETTKLGDLAHALGLDLDLAAKTLAEAIRLGVAAHDAMPDVTEPDPLRSLERRLPPTTSTAAVLRQASTHLDLYPGADPQAKLHIQKQLASLVPKPDGLTQRGKFYNDRVIVHEAAAGTLRMRIGGGLAEDLATAVPRALDLLAHQAVRTREHTNRRLARALGHGEFSLLAVISRHGELPFEADPWLTDAITSAIDAVPDATDIDLAEVVSPPAADSLPILCSADVMPTAWNLETYQPGRTLLVLGDVHDCVLLTPWALQFHPDAAGVLARRDNMINQAIGCRRVLSVAARRRTGLPTLRFPGPLVEIGSVAGPGERVMLDQLRVTSSGERAWLHLPGSDNELFLHNGELDTAVHAAFALPRVRPPVLPERHEVPRLRVGNVVLARRRWRLDLNACYGDRSAAERLLAVCRLVRANGWPTRFFAKAPHERKPIYVDTASPLLVECLLRLAHGAECLYASEVLPDAGELWLCDGQLRFAAELRCFYLRSAQ